MFSQRQYARYLMIDLRWILLPLSLTFGVTCAVVAQESPGQEVSMGALSGGLTIKGTLVNEDSIALADESLHLFLGGRKTTLDSPEDSSEGDGLRPVEGTGVINVRIEGIEGGGVLKVIKERAANPSSQTDEHGNFQFVVGAQFIAGEEELIVTVNRNTFSGGRANTESWPIVDDEGIPIILKIDEIEGIHELGKVRVLQSVN